MINQLLKLDINDKNRSGLVAHSKESIANLRRSLNLLEADLDKHHPEAQENGILITASICLAVDKAMEDAANELKKHGRL